MDNFEAYLQKLLPDKDSLKLVKSEAKKYYKSHSPEDCFNTGIKLYQSENFQIQEVGVFLSGYAAQHNTIALSFLKNTVSLHDSWKVQEILAMAFDNHCKMIGYEAALPIIKEWLNSTVIVLMFAELLRRDCGFGYVRKSIGNALRDISKKYPQIILEELSSWKLSSKEIKQASVATDLYLAK